MDVYRQVGYVFEPTREQLIGYFLRTKLSGQSLPPYYPQFVDFNVYSDHPSNILRLTKKARAILGEDGGDEGSDSGYFFTRLMKIRRNAKNFNRVVKDQGTWLDKSSTKKVCDCFGTAIGCYKYYKFTPFELKKDDPLNEHEWQMHEYTMYNNGDYNNEICRSFVLCHITRKKVADDDDSCHPSTHDQQSLLTKRDQPEEGSIIVSELNNNEDCNLSKRSCTGLDDGAGYQANNLEGMPNQVMPQAEYQGCIYTPVLSSDTNIAGVNQGQGGDILGMNGEYGAGYQANFGGMSSNQLIPQGEYHQGDVVYEQLLSSDTNNNNDGVINKGGDDFLGMDADFDDVLRYFRSNFQQEGDDQNQPIVGESLTGGTDPISLDLFERTSDPMRILLPI